MIATGKKYLCEDRLPRCPPTSFLVLGCLALALSATHAFAHGGAYLKPSDAELANMAPPLEGAEPFARSLAFEGQGLLSESQRDVLQRVLRHYDVAAGIRAGHHPDPGPQDAAYHRWLGDVTLGNLMDSLAPRMPAYDLRPGAKRPEPLDPVPFSGPEACILVKTVRGDAAPVFRVQELDLVQERYAHHFTLEIAERGTTFTLLRLANVPQASMTTAIAFQGDGATEPSDWHALTLQPLPRGHLEVDILDEYGATTPAMVRITSSPGGRLWAPPGAVDFRPMINEVTGPETIPALNIYGPGRALEVKLPGTFSGHYWVVPKPFEMTLPPGRYELTVYRGIEVRPVRETLEVLSGERTRRTVRLERWTDMRARGWYSGDDHVHARMMSSEDADKLMAFTRAMDVRVSNILEMGESQRTYYVQRGFGPDFRVHRDGYWLVPGQEDPRSMLGHNIGLNLTGLARDLDRYLQLDWVAAEVHRQGGLFGQTHVGQNMCEAHRGMALMVPRGIYDFCSIMQGGLGTELYYDFLDLGYRLAATAGSDTPYGGTLGNVRVYAFLGEGNVFTPDAWFDAVKQGRTFVSTGPMLAFEVEGQGPGGTVEVEDDIPLRVTARAWGQEEHSAPTALQIVRLSEVAKTVRQTDPSLTELSVSLSLPAGHGGWVAARAYGADGSAAHTTPVYVTRNGHRPWNRARAPSILARQLAVLDEIEGVIQEVEARQAAGQLGHLDFWNLRILWQAGPLRERLAVTRGIYQRLQKELASE